MRKIRSNLNGIFICLFEIIVGVLLLINPVSFTTGIIVTAGLTLAFFGIINIVRYFRTNAEEAALGQYLVKGLIMLLAGIFCSVKSYWFIATFPVLTVIYGIIVLITGIGKIQLTADMIRRKNRKWFLAVISAAISVISGAVILNNPFTSTTVLWMFTGITLIIEAIIDLVTLIISRRSDKSTEEDNDE